MKQRSLARNRLRRLSWLRFVLQLATVAGVYLGVSVAVPFAFLLASGGDAQNFVMTNPMLLSSAVLSMLAALIVARAWLASDGCLRHAWSIRRSIRGARWGWRRWAWEASSRCSDWAGWRSMRWTCPRSTFR